MLKNNSLKIRIFLSMILLVIVASVLIIGVTIYQYGEQTKEYNIERFGRKEEATKQDLENELKKYTNTNITSDSLEVIFRDRIYEIATVHKFSITIYDIDGEFVKSSVPKDIGDINATEKLSKDIIDQLSRVGGHRIFESNSYKGITYQTSYTYLKDSRYKRIGILELSIAQSNKEQEKELYEFITRLLLVYLFMLFIAIALAYFISTYITRSIKTISDKINETRLYKVNEKIKLEGASSEINTLVDAYNNMVDQLEESAIQLAKGEREQAWREMAKQVAHEIKNPLTPMRLSVQSFERRFDPEDPEIKVKMAEYSKTLIQQIDVMSSIASAFSDFAKMPKPKREKLDAVSVIKHALDIFDEPYIYYTANQPEIYLYFDKIQLVRIITNLVKNAMQALEGNSEKPKILIYVSDKIDTIEIKVSDNGKGIDKVHKKRIFEPKFTTKTSGMGLGLPMIKNIIEAYKGSISFTSIVGEGTVFKVLLPKK